MNLMNLNKNSIFNPIKYISHFHTFFALYLIISIIPFRTLAYCEFSMTSTGTQAESDKLEIAKEVKSLFDSKIDFIDATIKILERPKARSKSECQFTITTKNKVTKTYIKNYDECQEIKIRLRSKHFDYNCDKHSLLPLPDDSTKTINDNPM